MNSHTFHTEHGVTSVCAKGKANSHPRQKNKQPAIQVDITYVKSLDDKTSTPILTAIDVETGMSMATLIQDRTPHFEYLVNCVEVDVLERPLSARLVFVPIFGHHFGAH